MQVVVGTPFLFPLKADFARYRVTNGFFLVRVWASSRVLWAKRRVLISVSLGRAAPSERNDWISISAPFLLMSPGVDQPLPPVLVCVCVVRKGPGWPLSYSGSFLVILLVGGQYWLLMLPLGEGSRMWRHSEMYSTITWLPNLSNALLWFNLQHPQYFCLFQIGPWILSLH